MRLAMVLGVMVAAWCSVAASADAIIIGQGEVVHVGSAEKPASVSTVEAATTAETTGELYNIGLLILAPLALGLLLRRRWRSLPRRATSNDLSVVLIGLMFFAGLYLAQIIGGLLAGPHVGAPGENGGFAIPPDDLRAQALLRLAGYAAAGPILVFYLIRAGRAPSELESSNPETPASSGLLWHMALGLGGLLLFWPLVNTAAFAGAGLMHWMTGDQPADVSHSTLRLLLDPAQGWWRWVTIGTVVLLTPLFEEAAYRGMIQGAMTQLSRSPWLGVIITSLLFVAMHITALRSPEGLIQWNGLFSLFVLSLGFGWLRERSRSLVGPIIMHAGFNLANILLAIFVAGR